MFFDIKNAATALGCLLASTMLVPAASAEVRFGVSEYAGVQQCLRDAGTLAVKSCRHYFRVGKSTKLNYTELPRDFSPTVVLEFIDVPGGVHAAIVRGDFDDGLRELVALAKRDGRPVRFSPMHEGNSWWHNHGGYYEGQSPESYVAAFRYVHDFIVREAGSDLEVSFEQILNPTSFGSEKQSLGQSDFAQFNPGAEYVDSVATPVYNRGGLDGTCNNVRTLVTALDITYDALLQFGKPIGISELGSTPYCDVNLVEIYQELFEALPTQFAEVTYVDFFVRNVPAGEASNDVDTGWDAMLLTYPDELRSLIHGRSVPATVPTFPNERGDAVVSPRETSLVSTEPFGISSSWTFPWEGWTDARYTWGDEPIPGYGQAGFILQGTFRQSALRDVGWAEVGPSLLLGYVQSDVCNDRYWQCQVRAELSLRAVMRPLPDFGDYRRLDFAVGIGHRQYTGSNVPDRVGGGDTYGFVGVTAVFGGDWN